MKHSFISRLALTCVGLLSIAVPAAAQTGFRCDTPRLARVDATACALGARDIASLRRYVARTQAIHDLQMSDYVRPDGARTAALPVQPAPAAPPSSVAVSHLLPRNEQ